MSAQQGTDAVRAGQQATEGIVDKIKGLTSNPMVMVWFYFMGWPMIRDKIWPQKVDEAGVPLPVPAEPFSFVHFVCKGFCYIAFFGIAMLLMIYFKQETMLYVPAQPY